MHLDFTQSLILLLLGLLFFKETVLEWFAERFGFSLKKDDQMGPPVPQNLLQLTIKQMESALVPLSDQLETLGSNHIEHVQRGVDDIKASQSRQNEILIDMRNSLQNIEKYGINCRK